MKKTFSAVAFILAALLMITMLSACADQSAAAPTAAPEAAAPAESAEPVDPLVGAWRMPPSPYGDDFTCYVVLNADGSFMNVTNVYQNGATSGPYTQQIFTNEDFTWVKTNDVTLELHYNYHDDNGEFITTLNYDPTADSLYLWGQVYAVRDNSFVLTA